MEDSSKHLAEQLPRQLSEYLPEQLLERAIASGAQAAEVFCSSALSRPVIFEGNRLKQAETIQSEGVALRLWRDGRPGLSVGYGPIDPQTLVEKALATSTLNAPEVPNLSVGSQKTFPVLGARVEVEVLVDWGKEAIARLLDRFPELICEGELACETEYTRLINSTGLDYRSEDILLSGYLDAARVNQDDFLNVGDGAVGRQRLDMLAVTDSIIKRLSWAKRTVSPPTGQVPVIFTPAAAWLLWNTLRAALDGKRVQEGTSPLSNRWGDRIVDEAINLRQDPTIGPYSCPFDDEGVLTQALVLVEAGRVKNWYCDRTIGQPKSNDSSPAAVTPGLGNGSTGNGIRPSLGSYPTPGLINLMITPGEADWNQLIAQHENAIIIDQVLGEGGDITGDMSVNLELGYWVNQGEIVGRLKDTMVSGNAYSALNHLIALGCDAEWQGSTHTPAVAVGSLSVTG
jgi:PmbA protein